MRKQPVKFNNVFAKAGIMFIAVFLIGGFYDRWPANAATAGPVEVGAPLSPDLTNEAALFSRVAQFGSVRVIVQFEAAFQPEGELASVARIENQRMAIDITQDVVLNSLASHDVRNVKRFHTIPYMALEVDEAALDALWMDPDIVSIQEDIPVAPTLADSVALIHADDVWGEGFDATDIVVAILDTGVDKTHAFLDNGKVVSEACYSSNTGEPYNSQTVCPNDLEEQEGSGAGVNCDTDIYGCDHGTHVAGIAAGIGAVLEFDGVARGAGIIAVQVFSEFSGQICGSPTSRCALSWTSDQIKGLERIYELRDTFSIAAVNMSLGGGRYESNCNDDPRKAIIDNLRSEGIATVISSGNSYYKDALGAPACISSAISVGATSKSDSVASFSNSASFLKLLAPGVSIQSSIPGNNYNFKSGTSMAAPHVTGAFALLKHADPGASVWDILWTLRATGLGVTDTNGITTPRIDVSAAYNKPEITLPVPGSEINTNPVTFTWTGHGLSVNNWDLWLGTAKGKADLYDSPSLNPGVKSKTVSCVPLAGDPVYARLRFKRNGKWWYFDYQFTTSSNVPDITSPSTAAPLSNTSLNFEWDSNGLCVDAWKLYAGTTPGANDLYTSGKLPGSDTEHTANGLPFDGSAVHIRLRYQAGGVWYHRDYQYDAVTWNIGITDPVAGSQFESRNVTFQWTTDSAPPETIAKWRLYVGSAPGRDNYYYSGNLAAEVTETEVTALPRNGRQIYVRLMFKLNGIWESAYYQYMALDTLPMITDPEPGSTLEGSSVTFSWTPESDTVQRWKLFVGSTPGLKDYCNSGGLEVDVLSYTCNGLPTDGSPIHVRLLYKKNDKWKTRDYQYTAQAAAP